MPTTLRCKNIYCVMSNQNNPCYFSKLLIVRNLPTFLKKYIAIFVLAAEIFISCHLSTDKTVKQNQCYNGIQGWLKFLLKYVNWSRIAITTIVEPSNTWRLFLIRKNQHIHNERYQTVKHIFLQYFLILSGTIVPIYKKKTSSTCTNVSSFCSNNLLQIVVQHQLV